MPRPDRRKRCSIHLWRSLVSSNTPSSRRRNSAGSCLSDRGAAMNLPGFSAEASVYKTSRLYRGYAGTGNLEARVYAPATRLDWTVSDCTGNSTPPGCTDVCTISCFLWWCWISDCSRKCCYQVSPDQIQCEIENFDGPCPAAPPPPPPPPGCCPPGRRCCGSCASGTCDDICVSPGQQCP